MEKMYTVQPGNRLTGKHRVYESGENIPESELCGDVQGSIKDGVIREVGAAPVVQVAVKTQEPERTKEPEKDGGAPNSIFEQLMAKTDAELLGIAKSDEYKVDEPEKLPADKAALVKAIMRKAGYNVLVDKIEAAEKDGAMRNRRPGRPSGNGKKDGAK
jgi:hypothetical protein